MRPVYYAATTAGDADLVRVGEFVLWLACLWLVGTVTFQLLRFALEFGRDPVVVAAPQPSAVPTQRVDSAPSIPVIVSAPTGIADDPQDAQTQVQR